MKIHIRFKDLPICHATAKRKFRFASSREKFADVPEAEKCKNCKRIVEK